MNTKELVDMEQLCVDLVIIVLGFLNPVELHTMEFVSTTFYNLSKTNKYLKSYKRNRLSDSVYAEIGKLPTNIKKAIYKELAYIEKYDGDYSDSGIDGLYKLEGKKYDIIEQKIWKYISPIKNIFDTYPSLVLNVNTILPRGINGVKIFLFVCDNENDNICSSIANELNKISERQLLSVGSKRSSVTIVYTYNDESHSTKFKYYLSTNTYKSYSHYIASNKYSHNMLIYCKYGFYANDIYIECVNGGMHIDLFYKIAPVISERKYFYRNIEGIRNCLTINEENKSSYNSIQHSGNVRIKIYDHTKYCISQPVIPYGVNEYFFMFQWAYFCNKIQDLPDTREYNILRYMICLYDIILTEEDTAFIRLIFSDLVNKLILKCKYESLAKSYNFYHLMPRILYLKKNKIISSLMDILSINKIFSSCGIDCNNSQEDFPSEFMEKLHTINISIDKSQLKTLLQSYRVPTFFDVNEHLEIYLCYEYSMYGTVNEYAYSSRINHLFLSNIDYIVLSVDYEVIDYDVFNDDFGCNDYLDRTDATDKMFYDAVEQNIDKLDLGSIGINIIKKCLPILMFHKITDHKKHIKRIIIECYIENIYMKPIECLFMAFHYKLDSVAIYKIKQLYQEGNKGDDIFFNFLEYIFEEGHSIPIIYKKRISKILINIGSRYNRENPINILHDVRPLDMILSLLKLCKFLKLCRTANLARFVKCKCVNEIRKHIKTQSDLSQFLRMVFEHLNV